MKKVIALLSVAVLAIVSFAYTKAQIGRKEGFSTEALTSKLKDVNGKEILFQDIINKHKGKPIVIEAWASWCGDCVKNMPKLKELQTEFPNAAFVFLSADKTSEAWLKGIEKHDLKGDHFLMDGGMKGSFGKAINLDWIPRYIIIDKTGKVALYRAIETDHDQVSSLLKTL